MIVGISEHHVSYRLAVLAAAGHARQQQHLLRQRVLQLALPGKGKQGVMNGDHQDFGWGPVAFLMPAVFLRCPSFPSEGA